MDILNSISQSMLRGRIKDILSDITIAIDRGISAKEILDKSLIRTMEDIGEKFSKRQVFIPEVMMAARAMNEAMVLLKPHLINSGIEPIGKVVICTVKGDSHDIGKNLVKIMLEGVGIEVIDLGVNVPSEKIIQTAIDNNIKVICLSSLLTTTMPMLKDVIAKLKEQKIRDQYKVVVGGAPVTQSFADSIGADGYTQDAASASKLVKSYFITSKAYNS